MSDWGGEAWPLPSYCLQGGQDQGQHVDDDVADVASGRVYCSSPSQHHHGGSAEPREMLWEQSPPVMKKKENDTRHRNKDPLMLPYYI